MHNKSVYQIVITGASRGIGLELTRQYVLEGLTDGQTCRVIATCRNLQRAPRLKRLLEELSEQQKDNLVIQELDVTDEASVRAFALSLAGQPVDLLINNAGVYGPNAPLLPVDIKKWQEVLRLNCIAPVNLSQQLFENLKLSQAAKIVTISSDMGSISSNTGGGAYLYRSSKAALNAAMYSLSIDLKELGICVMMLHPGHVMTEMGGPNAKLPVTESALGLRKVIDTTSIADSGAFKNWKGEIMPW